MLVQLSDVHFGYPGTELFESVSWQVNPGERIGLVGPNGAGKSTLLRLLDGQLAPDRGQVARARGVTVAYLHQSQEFHGHGTLWETLMEQFAELLAMREELHALEHALTEGDLARYGHLQEVYARRGGYTLESRVSQLAGELGFGDDDLARSVATLSGGERGRVELAKVLLAQPDLLLLDEPTNHLDVDAVERLEDRLKEWPGAFVVVSHDRYFLRAVCREIVDVEEGGIVRYPGGYDKYVVAHQERLERMTSAWRRQKESIEKTEDFIRRNIAGQNTKQAKSRRKMLERVERIDRPRDEWAEAGNFKLRFSAGDHRGGREALKAEGVTIGYPGAEPVVRSLDLTIFRGERVGIVGPNGAGKTTLLKALLGQLAPVAGAIFRGHEVRVGYFDQKLADLDEERSLIDEVRAVRGDWNEDRVRSYLGMFRFTGDDGLRKIKGLSGGERNRLSLAKMMLLPRNLLAMDEPTNHLDIPAREVLEDALSEYDGTIVVVSHDRFFLDRICNRILHLHDGRVEAHLGNYSDWRHRGGKSRGDGDGNANFLYRVSGVVSAGAEGNGNANFLHRVSGVVSAGAEGNGNDRKTQAKAQTKATVPVVEDRVVRAQEREVKKQSDRERQKKERRLGELEKQIGEAEVELASARAALASDHGGDWQRLNGLVENERRLANRVKSLMGEWERLGSELGA
ncbi:MAG: ABC-F family ATP-binding cassette domain-containing protein [Myxococcales bacterium]|nr:ABC-F family ATP-binding cassette domain-containing protein [Myxococcales bacterium]